MPRGGKREGAGRPKKDPAAGKREIVTVFLSPLTKKEIDRRRAEMKKSAGEIIDDAIDRKR